MTKIQFLLSLLISLFYLLSFSAFGIGPSGIGSCALDFYGQCWQFTGAQWTEEYAAEQCKNVGSRGGEFRPGKTCRRSTLSGHCEHNPQGSAAYRIQIRYYVPNFQLQQAVLACNGHPFNRWRRG